MRNQDEDLEKMGGSVHVLKNISAQIGGELDEQSVWVAHHQCTINTFGTFPADELHVTLEC